jgi:hypothetical protein
MTMVGVQRGLGLLAGGELQEIGFGGGVGQLLQKEVLPF